MNQIPWIAVAVVACAAGVYGLVAAIVRVRRLITSVTEHTLPVVAQQTFQMEDVGGKCLHLEGPRFTIRFARLSFALIDGSTNTAVRLKPVLLRAVIGGFKKVRLLFKTFSIDHAGPYRLEISGLRGETDYGDLRIVITKPYLAKMTLYILGLIVCLWIIFGGIAIMVLRLTDQL